jgi:transcriptional regulator with XRE-family HTH domain
MMGNRLKDILTREGVTAYRACKDLGIDRGQLSRFLTGKDNLTLAKLTKIADYLGYDLVLVKRKHTQEGE